MHSLRGLLLRAFGLALLVHLFLTAMFVVLLVEFNLPFRVDPASGLGGAQTPYSLGPGLYILLACVVVAAFQVGIVWVFMRHPVNAVKAATKFVGALPYRYGGQLTIEDTTISELSALITALNATSVRLSIQDDALASLEVRLKAVVDAMPETVFFKSRQGCFLICNKAYADFVGRPELQIIGYDEADVVNPATAEAHQLIEADVFASGMPHVSRAWIQHPSGQRYLIETSRSLLRAQDGTAIGLLGVGRDITQEVLRLKAEHAHSKIFQMLAGGRSLTEVLKQVVRHIESKQTLWHCAVMTANDSGDTLNVVAAPSLPAVFVERYRALSIADGNCCCASAARNRERYIVPNLYEHPFWMAHHQLLDEAHVSTCWAQPVLSAHDEVLGVIVVFRPAADEAADKQISPLIEEAASLASIAIERCRDEAKLKLAAMVYNASNEAIFVTDLDNTVIAVNPAFEKITGYKASDILHQPSRMLDSERGSADFAEQMQRSLQGTGNWQGEIWSRRKNGEPFAGYLTITTTDVDTIGDRHRVGLFTDVTERKRSEEIIWFQANNDALTGLPNRRLFRDRLEQDIARAQRAGQRVALIFLDLDHFKQVNDALGHEAGDLLLIEAARRLRSCVRGADTVARLGGDEFTVTLPNFGNIATVERICKSILSHLSEPFELNGEKAYISASLGVTQYPDDAQDIEGLLKNADQSMYVAKQQGRNTFSWFTAELRDAAHEWHNLANDLRQALSNNELAVHFQPIIDLHTHLPVKAEALVRWQHPTRGMVSPVVFIPIAEEIGLIGEIGDWVFREAIRQASCWPLVGGQSVAISVNKSPRQFIHAEENQDWIAYLNEVNFDPARLVVEITEGLLLEERANVGAQLFALRSAGAKIAIDDFGTGYSSLSYLKKFPIDFIKIDRSFVRDVSIDINDRALCEAIIAIANLLGMQVVAEGVETEEQRSFLYNAGGDFGQGYLFAKPMSGDDFMRFLSVPHLIDTQAAA